MFFSMSSVSRSLSAGAALASRGNLLDNRIKSPFLVSIRRCPLISTMEMLAWDAMILILWESSRWRGAEAVFPGAEQIVRFLKGSDGGQILVGGDAQGRVTDVFPGKEGSQIVLAGFCGELRFAVDDEVRS